MKPADEMAVKIQETVHMLGELEAFLGISLERAIECAMRVHGAYLGNPVDEKWVLDLQARQRHNRKGASHESRLRIVRTTLARVPGDDPLAGWEITDPAALLPPE